MPHQVRSADATPTSPHSPDERAKRDIYLQVLALSREHASRSKFFSDILALVGRQFSAPYAAVHARFGAEIIQHDFHSGPTDPKFWKDSLQHFLTDSLALSKARTKLLRSKKGHASVAFISAPLLDQQGSTVGAVALVIAPAEEHRVPAQLAELDGLARFAGYVGGAGMQSTSRGNSHANDDEEQQARAMAQAGACKSTEELAFSITNDLRNKLGCEQVALGWVVKRRVRILSISGFDEVKHQTPGVVHLRGAMEECLDAHEIVTYQRSGDWNAGEQQSSYRLHKQWHVAVKGDAVASIPLHVGDEIVAILSLRARADKGFRQEELPRIRTAVEAYAPALLLTRRAGRTMGKHLSESIGDFARTFKQPGSWRRRIAAIGLALSTIWFCFGTMAYNMTVPCVVRPAHVRHVVAPFDAKLTAVKVREGDRIKQGDLLCTFDRRELEQHRAKLIAQVTVNQKESDRAMAADQPVDVQLAIANRNLAKAQLAIVERKLEQSMIRAPFDGVVVAGDLRKRVGSVLERGAPLFEVAPMERWIVELEVPQSGVGHLKAQLAGVLATHARPEQVQHFKIGSIAPTTEVRNGASVYVTEASLIAPPAWLRAGMEGVAKIHVGREPVWWVTLHEFIDYLRISFWL